MTEIEKIKSEIAQADLLAAIQALKLLTKNSSLSNDLLQLESRFNQNEKANIGHKVMGLKVISETDGKDFKGSGEGALRETFKSIFGNFIIPCMWLLWDEKKQNLYDKVSKTLVVRKTRVG